MRLQKDLREFIELLNSQEVEYVVVGGHAVAFHGFPRYTGDIDFLVRPTPENARKLVAALEAFGFGLPDLTPDLFTQADTVVQLGVPPNRIDLLTSVSGVTFEQVWAHRVETTMDGLSVRMIGFEDLLANKQAAARGKDLADIEELRKTKIS